MVVTTRLLAALLAVSGFSLSFTHAHHAAVPLGDNLGLPSDADVDIDIAKRRAPQIFNAVHDSMRQWGASLHHNGMSFFLATVPEGVVFHHGNNQAQSPTNPDWLAYEIEHAEGFARGGRGPPGGGGGGGPGKGPGNGGRPPPPPSAVLDKDRDSHQHELRKRHSDRKPQREEEQEEKEQEEQKGGWLHSYVTTRPMHYLYVDGMSGGKTSMGTLDSQDYLLRRQKREDGDGDGDGTPNWDERDRAAQVCALSQDWGLDGVIRMEAGFEIIQCDFANGLTQLHALQRPPPSQGGGRGRGGGGGGMFAGFEFIRGLAERYHDIGSSRTIVDYSSMVSAYFFPDVNLTNPDPTRPDLPRLVSNTDATLAPILAALNRTISAARLGDPVVPPPQQQQQRTIDWRDVTDLVVGRYADRLKYMAEKTTTVRAIADELNFLLTAFLDYSGQDGDEDDIITPSIQRCANLYLHAVQPTTEADHLILAAIQTVTTEICTRLFAVRQLVVPPTSSSTKADDDDDDDKAIFDKAVAQLDALTAYLAWARFKRCPPCDVDEVCSIPMWPMGSKASYEQPRCVGSEHMDDGESYWGHRGPGGRPGRGRGGGGGRQQQQPGEGKEGQDAQHA